MKRIHLLPNTLTALGLLCGLFVIFKLNMTGVGAVDEVVLKKAAAFLLLASLFDLLDGALARAFHVESEFGGFFDSLADSITFGVAPSVIVLKSLSAEPGTFLSFLITSAAMIFTISGVLRLVRFSVDSARRRHPDFDVTGKAHFTGLPIPAAAAAVVSLDFFLISPETQLWFPTGELARTLILFSAMILVGYLMLSTWEFFSMKGLQRKVHSFPVLAGTVLFAVFLFYGLLYHFATVFFIFSWGYLTMAWGVSVGRYLKS